MLLDKLLNSTENDYIDFKQKWYSGDGIKVNLIQDILCLSNSLSDSLDRYIVIGVAEDKITKQKTIHDVSTDCNTQPSENIIQTLRNYMPVIPQIEVIREQVANQYIDVIKITPLVRDLPYVLNKSCEYEDKNKKKHTLHKDFIYSRNGSRNTGLNEHCSKATLEELFARKKGEHLPILDRFSLYLKDIDSWKHPQSSSASKLSENSYYYTKNHKFKIVRNEPISESHFTIYQVIDYYQLLMDTCLSENYWEARIDGTGMCYDDCYGTFSVELWADNTLIEVYEIVEIYIKHYNYDRYRQDFYIPDRSCILKTSDSIKNKEELQNTIEWKICKLLFEFDLYPESIHNNKDASIILDEVNYSYLSNPKKYLDENKKLLYEPANKQIKT